MTAPELEASLYVQRGNPYGGTFLRLKDDHGNLVYRGYHSGLVDGF